MTQKKSKIFKHEIYSKPFKKDYATNKTDVYHVDDIRSLDILDLKDHGPAKNGGYRYVLVIRDNFSNYGWTAPLKNKNVLTIKKLSQKCNYKFKKTKFNRNRSL